MKKKTKYKKGEIIPIENIDEEELSRAITEFSEGNKNLKKAIVSCIENNVKTIASCAGHGISVSPYLSMIVTSENIYNILSIMDCVAKKKGTSISLSFNEKIESVLTIYANNLNKNRIFREIERAAREKKKPEEVNEEVRALWEMHKNLRLHSHRFNELYNTATYINGYNSKEINFIFHTDYYSIIEIIKSLKLKHKKDLLGTKIYYHKSHDILEIINIMSKMAKEVKENFLENKQDEFYIPNQELKSIEVNREDLNDRIIEKREAINDKRKKTSEIKQDLNREER